MTKKKSDAAEQAVEKKPKRKRTSSRKPPKKKQADAAEVREELAGLVKSGAKDIAKAVIGHAKQGELAPAKYLLEMAGVFPPTGDAEQVSEEEDCLAKTLLDRLNEPGNATPEEPAHEGEKSAGAKAKTSGEAPGDLGNQDDASAEGLG